MDLLSPPRPRFAIVALASGALAVTATHVREPRYVRHGDGNLKQYGAALAADKTTLLTVDRAEDAFVLRFDRVEDGKVREESRVVLGDTIVAGLDVRGDIAAVHTGHLSGDEIRFFGRATKGWKAVQRLELSKECTDRSMFFTDVHLGDDLAVVESREVWCVFERRGRWTLTRTIPHETGESIRVSKNRIYLQTDARIDELVRDGMEWKRTTILTPPEEHQFSSFEVSERWLLAKTTEVVTLEDALEIHDLDDGAKLALTIELTTYQGATWIGIGETALAYTGEYGQYAWCFDRAWHFCGALEGPHGTFPLRRVAIGDVIWIGDPEDPYETSERGRAYGYDIR